MIAARPLLSPVVVVTLALGLGVNTAVFSQSGVAAERHRADLTE